ncbi:unnamed protein product [Adineta ricciae]|uniref:F-box domain-containing protein n=1 Tax=Adineta ricciae TaxID=249248 RepID=A0A815HGY9_ADIRI|nr:unnamed protein product [Adineta ricciae]CAF1352294.1 unnamed protein product [Adineta ricciae]
MITRLEDLCNEILLDIFDYADARDVYRGFWNLNSRLNKLLASIDYFSLVVDHDENNETIALLGPHIGQLIINSWEEIDLERFSNLFSLMLTRPSARQLKQIRADTMSKLRYISLCSNMYLSLPNQLAHDIFSSRFSRLRWARLGHIDTLNSFQWSQSLSLRHLQVDCSHTTMIPYILMLCPNLSHLHVDFLRQGERISPSPSAISNHPLRRFILRDYCRVVSYDDIETLIRLIPNTEKIELRFLCKTPFMTLIQYLCSHLHRLQRFDCDITECPISATNLATIRQVHPCFQSIECRTSGVDFRIFSTKT